MIASPRPQTTDDQRQALELLERSKRVVLTGHMHPDGDCIGSQAALHQILAARGKTVWILNPDLPEPQFDYLSQACQFGRFEGGPVPEHDLTVLLDCSELSRCGELGDVLSRMPSKKLVVDHHIHEDAAWWDAAFRDFKCAATGLLVWRIAQLWGVQLDPIAASGVFTSIVTDTGWFKYSNTDAETLRVASELVSAGVAPSRVYSAIYQRKPAASPLLLGQALSTLQYFADGRLAVFELPLDAEGRAQNLESEDLLDLARAVAAVEVVILVRVVSAGKCKLSLRSKTDYDVNRLARRFQGGGHAKAAGATVEGSLEDVRSRVVSAALEGF